MSDSIIVPHGIKPADDVLGKIKEFLSAFEPYEIQNGSKLVLLHDAKSQAFYLTSHLNAKTLIAKCDLEAALDGNENDEIYKLNRDFTEDPVAKVFIIEPDDYGRLAKIVKLVSTEIEGLSNLLLIHDDTLFCENTLHFINRHDPDVIINYSSCDESVNA